MNKIRLPGIDINLKQNCQEKQLTFKQIGKLLNDKILQTPPFQTDIDEIKVNQMIKSYRRNPDYLIYKNKIVIAVINDKIENEYKLYIIDGQHRLEMAKQLYETYELNDYLIFCYFSIENDKEMKKLFREINRDSYKNNQYVSLNEFRETLYISCCEYLRSKYSLYFSEKKSNVNKRYSVSEFMNKLLEHKYLDIFEDLNTLIKEIETKNKTFNKTVDYQEYYLENPELFYKDEINCVKDGYIFALTKNNFIDYLVNQEIIPNHVFKYQKKTISPKMRIEIWMKEFGTQNEAICPFYRCENKIHNGYKGFHSGHIISEFNGGETVLENLRPICGSCNSKMSSTNWIDYEKKCKLERKLKNKKVDIEL